MQRPQAIQLDITTPCQEDWNNMTACGTGRHCAHCNKTVIDFTTWSDTALYEFFAKDRGNVCGRLNVWQMNRPIHIPPQPHSRLYRMVMAMGLTLIFAQGADVYAQSKPPKVNDTKTNSRVWQYKEPCISGEMYGTILDEKKQPIIGAQVQVKQNGIVRVSCMTDFDGNYLLKPLVPDTYSLEVTFLKSKKLVTDILIQNCRVMQNIQLDTQLDTVITEKYKKKIPVPLDTVSYPMVGAVIANPVSHQHHSGRHTSRKTSGRSTNVSVNEDSLLNPSHKVYNKEEVEKMNIR